MSPRPTSVSMLAILLALPASLALPSPEGSPGADPREHDPKMMMERWQAAMTPGRQHQQLAGRIGTWDVETRLFGHGTEPAVSRGRAEFRWLVEGRWLAQEFDTTLMGAPYQGFGVHGYDNFKKKYVGTWVDTASTTMTSFEGNFDGSGKVMVEYGTLDEPMTGEHDKVVRFVTRELGDDEFVFEVHDLAIGLENTKVMEHHYRRRPAETP